MARVAEDFDKLGFKIRRGGIVSHFTAPRLHDRRFREMFGCSSIVCANAWLLIIEVFDEDMPSGATKVRFLWALNLLKAYDTEGNLSGNVGEGCDEKTFLYWTWYFIEILSERSVEIVRIILLFLFLAFLSFCFSFICNDTKQILTPISCPSSFVLFHKQRSISKIEK